jgi:hypothetical protein
MTLSVGIGKRTANLINYAGRHKLYMAGAATALPVFFIAANAQISGQDSNTNTNSNQSNFSSDNSSSNTESKESSETPESAQPELSPATNSNHTEATVTIDGQSVSASTNDANQSIHKTLTTENGSADISIDQQSSATSGEQSQSSNISIQSNSTGSSNSSSSDISNEHSSGGLPQ